MHLGQVHHLRENRFCCQVRCLAGGDEILREIWRFLARTTMPRKPGGPCQAPPASSLSYPGGQMRYGSLNVKISSLTVA